MVDCCRGLDQDGDGKEEDAVEQDGAEEGEEFGIQNGDLCNDKDLDDVEDPDPVFSEGCDPTQNPPDCDDDLPIVTPIPPVAVGCGEFDRDSDSDGDEMDDSSDDDSVDDMEVIIEEIEKEAEEEESEGEGDDSNVTGEEEWIDIVPGGEPVTFTNGATVDPRPKPEPEDGGDINIGEEEFGDDAGVGEEDEWMEVPGEGVDPAVVAVGPTDDGEAGWNPDDDVSDDESIISVIDIDEWTDPVPVPFAPGATYTAGATVTPRPKPIDIGEEEFSDTGSDAGSVISVVDIGEWTDEPGDDNPVVVAVGPTDDGEVTVEPVVVPGATFTNGATVTPRPRPEPEDGDEPPAQRPRPNPIDEPPLPPGEPLVNKPIDIGETEEPVPMVTEPTPDTEPVIPPGEPIIAPGATYTAGATVAPRPRPEPEPDIPPGEPLVDEPDVEISELIVKKINEFRARENPDLPPLVENIKLAQAAEFLAVHNDVAGIVSHDDDTYKGPSAHIDRAKAFGYDSTYIVENAGDAKGKTDGKTDEEIAEFIFQQWLNSKDGHRENMLLEDLVDVGVAFVGDKAVYVAGKNDKSANSTTIDEEIREPFRDEDAEREMVRLVNEFRKENGVSMINGDSGKRHDQLKKAADLLVNSNLERGEVSSDDSQFSGEGSHIDRVRSFGFRTDDVMQFAFQKEPGRALYEWFDTWKDTYKKKLLHPTLDNIAVSWIDDQLVIVAADDKDVTPDDLIQGLKKEYEDLGKEAYCTKYSCKQGAFHAPADPPPLDCGSPVSIGRGFNVSKV